jgi:hypothetical protein
MFNFGSHLLIHDRSDKCLLWYLCLLSEAILMGYQGNREEKKALIEMFICLTNPQN